MSITSTRKVSTSLSYGSSVKGAYDAQGRGQSFVETIDTSNNVSIHDEENSRGRQYYPSSSGDEVDDFEVHSSGQKQTLNHHFKSMQNIGPLLDNDEDVVSVVQDKSVGIYGTNQEISTVREKLDNPYFRVRSQTEESPDDIDEFV